MINILRATGALTLPDIKPNMTVSPPATVAPAASAQTKPGK